LLAGSKDKHAAEHNIVDRITGRDAVDNKLQLLQNSLSIKLAAALVTPPDAKLDPAKICKKITVLDSRLQCELEKHAIVAGARDKPQTNCAELRSELDDDVEHNGKHSERAEARRSQMLLANILAS
jgi:hypothetical protein